MYDRPAVSTNPWHDLPVYLREAVHVLRQPRGEEVLIPPDDVWIRKPTTVRAYSHRENRNLVLWADELGGWCIGRRFQSRTRMDDGEAWVAACGLFELAACEERYLPICVQMPLARSQDCPLPVPGSGVRGHVLEDLEVAHTLPGAPLSVSCRVTATSLARGGAATHIAEAMFGPPFRTRAGHPRVQFFLRDVLRAPVTLDVPDLQIAAQLVGALTRYVAELQPTGLLPASALGLNHRNQLARWKQTDLASGYDLLVKLPDSNGQTEYQLSGCFP